jgi:hypothetical protein
LLVQAVVALVQQEILCHLFLLLQETVVLE